MPKNKKKEGRIFVSRLRRIIGALKLAKLTIYRNSWIRKDSSTGLLGLVRTQMGAHVYSIWVLQRICPLKVKSRMIGVSKFLNLNSSYNFCIHSPM